ncbi:hypothetical protein ACFV0C_12395 [Streptomyces sp. NPDC059568]|uniref:hypothetical protein n=1 Tax=Streptomyces sp. NPDC059568 TaxID=3346868 RepID=UPI0036802A41
MDPITPSTPMTKSGEASLTSAVPLFDNSQLPLRGWCEGSREDPLTGLITFPDFHAHLPRELAGALANGGLVAIAIGDVDGLKDHVEKANTTEPGSFGHLAGNRVMARLGATTRKWFHEQSWTAGCAATFGGDEVIVAAAIDDAAMFHRAIGNLRDRLGAALPTPVSFALAVASAGHLPTLRIGNAWKHRFTDELLATVDRCLFAHKAERRASGRPGGILAVTEAPTTGRDGTASTTALLPLPVADESLHVLARPGTVAGRPVLLLSCTRPAGLRGRRFRVSRPDAAARTEVVVSARGQAVIPVAHAKPIAHGGPQTAGVPLVLRPIHDPADRTVPDDLAAALQRAGLDWDVLPSHEKAQMLHLITESAGSDIRRARVTAAVAAGAHARRRG